MVPDAGREVGPGLIGGGEPGAELDELDCLRDDDGDAGEEEGDDDGFLFGGGLDAEHDEDGEEGD